MRKLAVLLLLLTACTSSAPPAAPDTEVARWEQQAQNVTIVRDDWGIAHIRGATDADAVFGMVYAQAEDDFNRVETNFINAMGRLAEAEGESAIYQDLRMKLFIDPDSMRALYEESPDWLQELMDAWADGLNFYLHTHPEVTPRVIDRFEPWMALSFSEGSIGGDIERVDLEQLEAFYGSRSETTAAVASPEVEPEPKGSNGIAIAPSNTASGNAFAADQPAHLILLPLRAADNQRRGAERLRRRYLGAVLYLSGLQRTARVDAHLERRGCGGRVPRNGDGA